MIRPATSDDAHAIAHIYNHYILNTVVTFEEQAVAADELARRIDKVLSASLPYLVMLHDERIVGYAYAAPWHDRSAYRYSVETTVYLDNEHVGKGLGRTLYHTLLERLRTKRVHVAIGAIAIPNPASIALHERLGFTKVGHLAEVGLKFGRWIDVGYWQCLM